MNVSAADDTTSVDDSVEPISICFVMINILIWILQLCWTVVVWKYLNSKCPERQTLMDPQMKVNMIAWLLVNLSFQTTSALSLLSVQCHPTVAYIVTLTRQALFLWCTLAFLCSSVLKYVMVKYPGHLDAYADNLATACTSMTLVLGISDMIAINFALEGELPVDYYQLQGIKGKGSYEVSWLLFGQFIIFYGLSLIIQRKCYENPSTIELEETQSSNSLYNWPLVFKYLCYAFVAIPPVSVLVILAADLELINWLKVVPVLNSYFHSANALLIVVTVTWNNSELYQYVQRQALFVHLFWRRITGRNNSIQPFNLSGMI